MMMEIIRQENYKVTEWKGGITREILILPQGSSLAERNFDLRISSAVIESSESTFSDFTGYRRCLLPVDGDITLFRDSERISLKWNEPFFFDGSDKVRSTNTQGAIDFNVIYREGTNVKVSVVSGETVINTRSLIFALEALQMGKATLQPYDSVLIDSQTNCSGRAIVVSFA